MTEHKRVPLPFFSFLLLGCVMMNQVYVSDDREKYELLLTIKCLHKAIKFAEFLVTVGACRSARVLTPESAF